MHAGPRAIPFLIHSSNFWALPRQGKSLVILAGIEIIETQLSHLAYSPEIAQVMLRRQQAQAVIAARQLILDGAVGMVKMALRKSEADAVVTLYSLTDFYARAATLESKQQEKVKANGF